MTTSAFFFNIASAVIMVLLIVRLITSADD